MLRYAVLATWSGRASLRNGSFRSEAAAHTRLDGDGDVKASWTRTEAAAAARSDLDVDYPIFGTAPRLRRELSWTRKWLEAAAQAAIPDIDVDYTSLSTAHSLWREAGGLGEPGAPRIVSAHLPPAGGGAAVLESAPFITPLSSPHPQLPHPSTPHDIQRADGSVVPLDGPAMVSTCTLVQALSHPKSRVGEGDHPTARWIRQSSLPAPGGMAGHRDSPYGDRHLYRGRSISSTASWELRESNHGMVVGRGRWSGDLLDASLPSISTHLTPHLSSSPSSAASAIHLSAEAKHSSVIVLMRHVIR